MQINSYSPKCKCYNRDMCEILQNTGKELCVCEVKDLRIISDREREGRERDRERERERISEDMREFHEGVELFAMAGHLLWLKYRSQW